MGHGRFHPDISSAQQSFTSLLGDKPSPLNFPFLINPQEDVRPRGERVWLYPNDPIFPGRKRGKKERT